MTKSIAKKSTTGSLPPAVPLAIITPTFSPWTHTFDDSYIYQLSLVLATATVSFSAQYRQRKTYHSFQRTEHLKHLRRKLSSPPPSISSNTTPIFAAGATFPQVRLTYSSTPPPSPTIIFPSYKRATEYLEKKSNPTRSKVTPGL